MGKENVDPSMRSGNEGGLTRDLVKKEAPQANDEVYEHELPPDIPAGVLGPFDFICGDCVIDDADRIALEKLRESKERQRKLDAIQKRAQREVQQQKERTQQEAQRRKAEEADSMKSIPKDLREQLAGRWVADQAALEKKAQQESMIRPLSLDAASFSKFVLSKVRQKKPSPLSQMLYPFAPMSDDEYEMKIYGGSSSSQAPSMKQQASNSVSMKRGSSFPPNENITNYTNSRSGERKAPSFLPFSRHAEAISGAKLQHKQGP